LRLSISKENGELVLLDNNSFPRQLSVLFPLTRDLWKHLKSINIRAFMVGRSGILYFALRIMFHYIWHQLLSELSNFHLC